LYRNERGEAYLEDVVLPNHVGTERQEEKMGHKKKKKILHDDLAEDAQPITRSARGLESKN